MPEVWRGVARTTLRTRLTDLLDCDHPVMLAGMGGVADSTAR